MDLGEWSVGPCIRLEEFASGQDLMSAPTSLDGFDVFEFADSGMTPPVYVRGKGLACCSCTSSPAWCVSLPTTIADRGFTVFMPPMFGRASTPPATTRPNLPTVIHQHSHIGPTIKHETFHFGPAAQHYKDTRNYYVVEYRSGATAVSNEQSRYVYESFQRVMLLERSVQSRTPFLLRFANEAASVTATERWREWGTAARPPSRRAGEPVNRKMVLLSSFSSPAHQFTGLKSSPVHRLTCLKSFSCLSVFLRVRGWRRGGLVWRCRARRSRGGRPGRH